MASTRRSESRICDLQAGYAVRSRGRQYTASPTLEEWNSERAIRVIVPATSVEALYSSRLIELIASVNDVVINIIDRCIGRSPIARHPGGRRKQRRNRLPPGTEDPQECRAVTQRAAVSRPASAYDDPRLFTDSRCSERHARSNSGFVARLNPSNRGRHP